MKVQRFDVGPVERPATATVGEKEKGWEIQMKNRNLLSQSWP